MQRWRTLGLRESIDTLKTKDREANTEEAKVLLQIISKATAKMEIIHRLNMEINKTTTSTPLLHKVARNPNHFPACQCVTNADHLLHHASCQQQHKCQIGHTFYGYSPRDKTVEPLDHIGKHFIMHYCRFVRKKAAWGGCHGISQCWKKEKWDLWRFSMEKLSAKATVMHNW